MFVLEIQKTYLFGNATDGGYFRWICKKIELDSFPDNMELYSPIYRNRCDVILAVHEFSGYDVSNRNPVATEIFNQQINGNCLIHFENLNKQEFDIWCDIIKKDLKEAGALDESFEY